ncbi:helix-turn-helix transcriptional regulator [Clavibacter sepedonicus]|uniref:DNA-binding protein n=1 Tax=Clavibacter sepedonicus TaxID=31964 RepID=B0RIE9_CLASE|nr:MULTISPECIES: helix-turn-helix domain-containing protein [Clavibacter]OQJ48723.1 transcriptional regulator [Clavibacter sepedonicus]OQJ54267.1 transcriptional regulator [Clavibacter sepedonicus]UUK65814.1 helix-turn-helix domain-containing protein [Clavibacter sepedonicus]CAQ00263.1 putative DNA-binding protein [Clavibacter sepedonicus]
MRRFVIPWAAVGVGVSVLAAVLAVQHGRDPVAAVVSALVVLSSGPIGLAIRHRRDGRSRAAASGSVERAIVACTQAAVFRDLLIAIPAAALLQLLRPGQPPIMTSLMLMVFALADYGFRYDARLRACLQPGPGTNDLGAYRVAARMAAEDLARATGVSDRTVVAIENGRHEPGVVLARAIAIELGVPVARLFPGSMSGA